MWRIYAQMGIKIENQLYFVAFVAPALQDLRYPHDQYIPARSPPAAMTFQVFSSVTALMTALRLLVAFTHGFEIVVT